MLEKQALGYGESDIEQRRFSYVDNKALKIIVAAGLQGSTAECVREAVHANHRLIIDQFRTNETLAPPLDSTE